MSGRPILNPPKVVGHAITVEGLTASCSVCGQVWGGIEPVDILNLSQRMTCPGAEIHATSCPQNLNYWCMEPRCLTGCAKESS